MTVITLLTDFGADSPYVAAIKGVLLSIHPAATIVDITHSIEPQNVRQAALVLDQVCQRFPPGTIHLAVVDPGVGTERALLYIEIGQQRFVGPDNGIFSRLAHRTPPRTIIALENRDYWLPTVSATFHGRDIMAPVVGYLSLGIDPARLGPPRAEMILLDWPEPLVQPGLIRGEVLMIDSFGNAITNITRDHAQAITDLSQAHVKSGQQSIRGIARTYGDTPPGTPLALFGSTDLLEIAVACGSAARALRLQVGDEVRLEW